jgi:hypothetical protein
MNEREPNLVVSSLGKHFTADGVTVEVCIYRLENNPDWSLEVVNAAGTSIVWDDHFESDDKAWAEFLRTVDEDGMKSFQETATIIPFPGR